MCGEEGGEREGRGRGAKSFDCKGNVWEGGGGSVVRSLLGWW